MGEEFHFPGAAGVTDGLRSFGVHVDQWAAITGLPAPTMWMFLAVVFWVTAVLAILFAWRFLAGIAMFGENRPYRPHCHECHVADEQRRRLFNEAMARRMRTAWAWVREQAKRAVPAAQRARAKLLVVSKYPWRS